jgi:hypothetical protein
MRFKFFLLIFILVFACKSNENQPEFEKKPLEPDPFKRAKESAEKGGGLFTTHMHYSNFAWFILILIY